jgi:hypothetical protein
MDVLYLILYVIAAIMFIVAALAVNSTTTNHPVARFNLVALGLFAWVLVPLIQTIDTM